MIKIPKQLEFWTNSIEIESSKLPANKRGSIFTKPVVVEYMLDASGYTTRKALFKYKTLEPSFGEGEFVIPIAHRVFSSYLKSNKTKSDFNLLTHAVRAIEVSKESYNVCANRLEIICYEYGFSKKQTQNILSNWLVNREFLSYDLPNHFDYIFGNPPYIRYDNLLPKTKKYCQKYFNTFVDRCDLYVPFFEKTLFHLTQNGIHCFICSNRWMKSQYGRKLRMMITKSFELMKIVDVESIEAFEEKVTAYPSITFIKPGKNFLTSYLKVKEIENLGSNKQSLSSQPIKLPNESSKPWVLGDPETLKIINYMQKTFPLITDSCKVGIGVASGADSIYIGNFLNNIEKKCLLPIVKSKHIIKGKIQWLNDFIINPYDSDGRPINLKEKPLLKKYLYKNKALIMKRNCAKKNPDFWFKTIDKITPTLLSKEKILIPDIKCDSSSIVVDDGHFYPHHNIYWITSENWDIKSLAYLLKNGLASLFVHAFSTTMRGGYYRFQAQHLKKIRLPHWENIPKKNREKLIKSSRNESAQFDVSLFRDVFNLNLKDAMYIYNLKNSKNGS